MDRHTETLLPEICQKEKHGSIILQLLNMINRSFVYIEYDKAVPFSYIFQVAMSQCVDVP